jgi:ABC-type branched-subunit amino acid transport system permease subunit
MNWSDIVSGAVQQGFGPLTIVYCLAAIGLNVHFGYTGLLNFGQAAFMMVAGYSVASFVATWGLSLWLGVAVGLLAAVVLALLLGVPTLRLRADYLAIVTIAAAEAIRQILASVALSRYFNGYNGLSAFSNSFYALNPFESPKTVSIPGTSLSTTWGPRDFFCMVVGWTLVAICCALVWLLMRSPWGRVLKAIREDEDAVRSLGKNVFAYKMQSLVIGGVVGALAGILISLNQSNTSPAFFATDTTFFAYTVLLLGGAARVFGPVAGAIIFQLSISALDLFFDQATSGSNPLIPSSIMANDQASLVRFIAMGLILMLLMIFRPQGIFGDRRELAIDAR